MTDKKNPWQHAAYEGREYLTPEDISTAVLAGADKRKLMATVLDAIGRSQVEDARSCAFVATHGEPLGYERTTPSGGDSRG